MTEYTTSGDTTAFAVPERLSNFAVIVTDPSDNAVTIPEGPTVAMAVLDELQVARRVTSDVDPSPLTLDAVYCVVSLTVIVVSPDTLMLLTTALGDEGEVQPHVAAAETLIRKVITRFVISIRPQSMQPERCSGRATKVCL